MLSGLVSGAVGQLVAVPADLVKVRMQSDGVAVAQGRPPRYTGLLNAMTTIVQEEGGLRGLWRGSNPAVQRAALVSTVAKAAIVSFHVTLTGSWPASYSPVQVNLGELAMYDTAKSYILQLRNTNSLPHSQAGGKKPGDDVWTHTAASICSGFFASLVSTPADVIKTR
ncbi:hypothetical protein HDU93_001490 [Gonapodya sp. JEL0774]|nr:hypothetical protein HDU93_001490 [Gonapodya sp. JEL0774]